MKEKTIKFPVTKSSTLTANSFHIPVLLNEVIEGLDIKSGETVVDATLGLGGHAREIAGIIGKQGTFIGIDQDEEAIKRSRKALKSLAGFKGKARLTRGNFRNLSKILKRLKIPKADKILFDLGLSSYQLEASGRGFSFKRDEPLEMTFGKKPAGLFIARDIVNDWQEKNLEEIIRAYGEERFAGRIARAIVEKRKEKPIATTGELARIIEKSVPAWYRHKKIHPATKTFQALRITVNDELEALRAGLVSAVASLKHGGMVAVISFHSLEDRIVKNFFRNGSRDGILKIITKKPIVPGREEILRNPRSRSAKLRIAQKN